MHTYEEEDTHLAVWQLGAEAVAGEHFGVVVLFENFAHVDDCVLVLVERVRVHVVERLWGFWVLIGRSEVNRHQDVELCPASNELQKRRLVPHLKILNDHLSALFSVSLAGPLVFFEWHLKPSASTGNDLGHTSFSSAKEVVSRH